MASLRQRSGQALRLYFKFLGIAIRSRMEYRSDFLVGMGSVIILNAVNLSIIWVMISGFRVLAGWQFWEIVMLYGMFLLSHSVYAIFFWHLNTLEEDILRLRDWAEEHVQTPMERGSGVSSVAMRGGAERQVRIYLDPDRLAERGIRLSGLREVIRARNRDVSGGDLDSGKRRYLLRTIGRFDSVEEPW